VPFQISLAHYPLWIPAEGTGTAASGLGCAKTIQAVDGAQD
jgi:hypothetical protein